MNDEIEINAPARPDDATPDVATGSPTFHESAEAHRAALAAKRIAKIERDKAKHEAAVTETGFCTICLEDVPMAGCRVVREPGRGRHELEVIIAGKFHALVFGKQADVYRTRRSDFDRGVDPAVVPQETEKIELAPAAARLERMLAKQRARGADIVAEELLLQAIQETTND